MQVDLTKQAWEMGTPDFKLNHTRKLYTFDHPIGISNGKLVNTIDVRFSRNKGIHGFPTSP